MDTQDPPPPIEKSLDLSCSPERAFELFTEDIGKWWPLETHSMLAHRTGKKPRTCVMQGELGGRVFEIGEDGTECDWGHIIAWEPGHRVAWTWRLERPPEQATEIEVTFTHLDGGGTRVDLEHRDWHQLGEDAREMRENYNQGWDTVFTERFGGYARETAEP